ncbi:hypothetical protein DTO027B5_4819 [Paecilomyces variotii]|nr:hypothetical protein DTO169C6_8092 [Paecilomyces variotii]KAJ9322720.1 hypothetical protein DTO027B3_6302 [Paecilomyces variotii]KAJ9333449.1 hypothetical protein DTO027B5_4819 [Paecilomyces variotii]KAJ9397614.1 hypothetical protein DTO282F9_5440 [Paecilomyces variotii]
MQSSRPPGKARGIDWPTPSNLAVFVRNLKLLQLDQLPDWPDISVRSLSPSQQNQRQRIRGVEWGLYHLFAIWNPKETHSKLRPFFPPLEPLQSLNLRAALFRALSDVKKNGDLGREAILRKTMLDDCKGEKFEEILAVFSTAVLRKVLAARADLIANPVMRLATAKAIVPDDYQTMVPLILAHQWSLSTMSESQTRLQTNYERFTNLLKAKRDELVQRSGEKPKPRRKQGANYADLARELRENWLANEEWADALLDGGSQSSTDRFLELPFSEAWALANRGTADNQIHVPAGDLLADLESRLSRQQARLKKWREYRDSIQTPADQVRIASNDCSKESPLVFREHQALTIASISKAMRQPSGSTTPGTACHSLLSSLNDSLAKLKGRVDLPNRPVPKRIPTPEEDYSDSASTMLSPISLGNNIPLPSPRISITSTERERGSAGPVEGINDAAPIDKEPPTAKHISTDTNVEDNSGAGTPEPEPESDPVSDMKPIAENHSNITTLVERTRKSMSLLPPPNTRPQAEPARRPRPSYPVNQFETRRKKSRSPPPEISRASTPRDELFDEDAEYSSVFKSRPRIATSPIFSPMVHVQPIDDTLADHPDDASDLSYGELDMQSSPLAARTRYA